MKSRRISYQDLLKWSSANKVGNAMLYLLIRKLLRERKVRVSGEYVIGTLRINNNDIKLVIPMYIEAASEALRSGSTKRQVRQRLTRSTSILEALGEGGKVEQKGTEEAEGKAGEKPIVEMTKENAESRTNQEVVKEKVEESGAVTEAVEVTSGGVKDQGEAPIEEVTDYSTVSTNDLFSMLRNVINEEFPQNREEAFKVAVAMLSYLNKYWSVGELRLRSDIAKQFGGVNERILRVEDGVLRVLRKMGIIEIVEPGVVNRIRELPRDFVKVRLDSIFT